MRVHRSLRQCGLAVAAVLLLGAGEADAPADAAAVHPWQDFLSRNAVERFALLDADNDGGITREEFRGFLHQVFDTEGKGLAPNQEAILLTAFELTDTDYDGIIDRAEYRASSLAQTPPRVEVRPPLALGEAVNPLQFPPTEPYDTLPPHDPRLKPGKMTDGPPRERERERPPREGGGD